MPVEHYLTYQHNVQKYFRHHVDKYSGVIVPMSIVVSFPGGTYGFIRALCAKDKKKRYAIDPRTPLFQKDWNRANVRKPHERMADALGEPFATKGLAGPLDAADFSGDALSVVVERCLSYQKRFRTREEDARKLAKYKKLLGVEDLGELGDPQFLIPPYFQFNGEDDAWFEVSLRAVESAPAHSEGIPIRPVLHMQNWGAVRDWPAIVNRVKAVGCSELWLYPNFFKEHDASTEDLLLYRAAVEACTAAEVTPFVLFGGHYAIMLGAHGLGGFANGVGYGEWRDSGYHRGGTAIQRVYIPRLHRYLDAPAAQDILDRDADYFASGSDLLLACVESDRPLDDLSQEECLDHFMECRSDEIALLAAQGLDAARAELAETVARLDALGPLQKERYGDSLQRWLDAIE